MNIILRKYMKATVLRCISKTHYASSIYYMRNRYRLDSWENMDFQYIHIPKSAGTSIVSALGLPDPGHFTYSKMKHFGIVGNKSLFFTVVRDPESRIISTFKYAKRIQDIHGPNPLTWISKYDNPDEFIRDGLNSRIVNSNYFFMSNAKYLRGCPRDRLHLINFDNIEEEFMAVCSHIGKQNIVLPWENVSDKQSVVLSPESKEKIWLLYGNDVGDI